VIKLVALDLDGTLLGTVPEITPPVLATIRAVQALGVRIAVVTGRMYQGSLVYHQQLASDLPLVSYQGALIKDPADGRVHRHYPVPLLLAQDLYQRLQRYHLPIHIYRDDKLFLADPLNPMSERYIARTGVTPVLVEDLATVLTVPPTKLLAWVENDDIWHELIQHYDPQELHLTRSTSEFVEAIHPLSTKGEGVRYLAETLLGIGAEEVLAIGDYFNDQEMIQYAGIGVAMGSAPKAVQAFANWVAPTVEADGVKAALDKFVLESL